MFYIANLFLKQGISLEYVMVDFICMGLLDLWERRELQSEKFLSTVGFEPRTFRLQSERAKRWAVTSDTYQSPKGYRVLPELSMLITCTKW